MIDLSKVFKNAVLNQYKRGYFTVDYAILEASKLADKNKINATDYEELITYLAEEQEKQMQETVETVDENIVNTYETIEDNASVEEVVENTEENIEATEVAE